MATTSKRYSFDDHPEHRAQLEAWRDKWIANALNCTPMDEAERDRMRAAVDGLYRAADLAPPEPARVLFVSSPLVGAVAASIASGAWWLRDNPAEARKLFGRALGEPELMTSVATAAHVAIDRCLRSLRGEPVVAPATRAATYAATRDATRAATDAATYAATRDATRDATYAVAEFLVGCSVHWWKFWNGGNMWSGWVSYLTFFRHVAQLPLDYSKFEHYEALASAGPRFMHARFCIISDRPEVVHRDAANRPHRIDGPHIRWRDGVELHHIHGIRVTPRITAGQFTALECLEQPNAEVRRVMVVRYNGGDSGRWARDVGADVVHADVDSMGRPRRLLRIEQPGDEPYTVIEVTNSTPEPDGHCKLYAFRCAPDLRPHTDRGACHAVSRGSGSTRAELPERNRVDLRLLRARVPARHRDLTGSPRDRETGAVRGRSRARMGDIQRLALTRDLARRLAMAGHDELRVLDRVLLRIELGRERYGLLDLTKPRDWRAERFEERLDTLVYDVAGELALEDQARAELREAARIEMLVGAVPLVELPALGSDESPEWGAPDVGGEGG